MTVSVVLAAWANGNCDKVECVAAPVKTPITYTPIFPADANLSVEFTVAESKLLINKQPFTLKGVNWFGFETERHMAFGLNTNAQDATVSQLVNLSFNAVRLPLAAESILKPDWHIAPDWAVDHSLNFHMKPGAAYLEAVEQFAARNAQWGLLTLLDMHRLRYSTATYSVWHDDITSEEDVINAWEVLADRFCHSWYVMVSAPASRCRVRRRSAPCLRAGARFSPGCGPFQRTPRRDLG